MYNNNYLCTEGFVQASFVNFIQLHWTCGWYTVHGKYLMEENFGEPYRQKLLVRKIWQVSAYAKYILVYVSVNTGKKKFGE